MNIIFRLLSVHALIITSFSSITAIGTENIAREVLYVDNKIGSDDFNGRAAKPGADKEGPLATIMMAVKKCSVGAKIEIANTGVDYRESVAIQGFKKGRAGSPLEIDGHGAYVSGLVAIPKDRWVHLKDDVYYFLNRKDDVNGKPVYGRMPRNMWLVSKKHQGWFTEKEAPEIFFLNGKPGPNALSLEDIEPGGFFYDSQGTTLKEPAGNLCIYFRLPEKKTLKDCLVEVPLNGGILVGDDYITVSNIGSRYSQEDGFDGFWGQGVVLRNIHACYNCEQGVSFHGNGTTLIDGGLIERNGGAGIVDVMSSITIYRNVTVRDNFPTGIVLRGFAHAMYNCRIVGNTRTQISVNKGSSGSFTNCLIVGRGQKEGAYALELEYGRVDHCTILNSPVGVKIGERGSISDSIIAGCPTPLDINKTALPNLTVTKTILEQNGIIIDGRRIDSTGWDDFMKANPSVIVGAPALIEPLFSLPKDSPYLKAGTNGTPVGSTLTPFKEWIEQK